jgi:hypothetical protein
MRFEEAHTYLDDPDQESGGSHRLRQGSGKLLSHRRDEPMAPKFMAQLDSP